jgi:hypothetical protein
MDYNVLNFFPKGTKATSHYTLVALSFLVFSLVSYFFYKNLSFSVSKRIDYNQWMISFCVVFILARLFSVYLSLIFPERIITCLLAIFLLLYLKFNNTDKWLYGFMALLIAIYLTYCKEPIFGSLFILSLTNLIFNYKGLTRRNKIFYYLLIINCFVFSILYYFLVYKNITSFYTGGNRSLQKLTCLLEFSEKPQSSILCF